MHNIMVRVPCYYVINAQYGTPTASSGVHFCSACLAKLYGSNHKQEKYRKWKKLELKKIQNKWKQLEMNDEQWAYQGIAMSNCNSTRKKNLYLKWNKTEKNLATQHATVVDVCNATASMSPPRWHRNLQHSNARVWCVSSISSIKVKTCANLFTKQN